MKKTGMALLAMTLASPVHGEDAATPSAETAPASEAAAPVASNQEVSDTFVLVASDPEALDTVPARVSPERTGDEELQLALAAGADPYSIPAAAAVGVTRESDDAIAMDEGAPAQAENQWPAAGSSLESPWDAWENRDSATDSRDAWDDGSYTWDDAGNDYWDDAGDDQWDGGRDY